MLAELDVDAAVAEAELLESVGGAEVSVVLGALPRGGARLEAPEGPLVVERDGGGRDGVAEEARRQVRADLERRGRVLRGGDRDRAGTGAQRQRRRRRAPPHVSGAATPLPGFSFFRRKKFGETRPVRTVWGSGDGEFCFVALRPCRRDSCIRAIRPCLYRRLADSLRRCHSSQRLIAQFLLCF